MTSRLGHTNVMSEEEAPEYTDAVSHHDRMQFWTVGCTGEGSIELLAEKLQLNRIFTLSLAICCNNYTDWI
jgi:hypothetical protein